jgi:tRNA pseudouridine55 synthase
VTDENFSGLLLLDKPPGVTSHDAVLEVRRRLRSPGAGHLGTLDPPASGLLLVAMGAATRAIPVWAGGEKTYEARIRFGVTTSTQDLAGEVLTRAATESLTEAAIRHAATRFVGDIRQIPPMVSALKVGGERLHRLARRGVSVERAPRLVHVRDWEWLGFDLPEAGFRVRCSGGTYVRTLAHDLGSALGCGAALAGLRRTQIGPYHVRGASSWEALLGEPAEVTIARAGVPLDRALDVLPAIELDAEAEALIGSGRRPVVRLGNAPLQAGSRSVVMRSREGRALALGELEPHGRSGLAVACPHVVFPWAVRRGPGASTEPARPLDPAPRSS